MGEKGEGEGEGEGGGQWGREERKGEGGVRRA